MTNHKENYTELEKLTKKELIEQIKLNDQLIDYWHNQYKKAKGIA